MINKCKNNKRNHKDCFTKNTISQRDRKSTKLTNKVVNRSSLQPDTQSTYTSLQCNGSK